MPENYPSSESPSLPRLVVERGPHLDETFSLDAPPITIGRSASNNLVFNDPELSRQHARIVTHRKGLALEDLGSTNGTFINGQRCTGVTPLQDGDLIEFGDTVAVRFLDGADQAAPSESAWSPEDEDTLGNLTPVPPVLPPSPSPMPPPPMPAAMADEPPDPFADLPAETDSNRNRILIGCGCALVLACMLCVVTVIVLDAYDQGRLLYCGGLRPLWETLLGPFGFNPICP